MSLKWFDRYHTTQGLHFQLNPKYYLKEETAVYMTHVMKHLALSLIAIYIPMYIFTQTKSYNLFHIDETVNGILWTLSYYAVKSFIALLVVLLLSPLIFSRINFQRSLLISSVAQIIEIILLIKGANNPKIIILASAFSALEVIFYWIPYHILFLKKTIDSTNNFGQKTSLRFFLHRLCAGVSPLIGGIVLSKFGYNTLFISALVLIFMSSFPIITMVQEWKHHKHSVKNVMKELCLNKKYALITTSLCGQALQSLILAVFWPVLLYLVLQNFVKIGLLKSVSLLATSFALLIVGKWVDKGKSQLVHSIGVTLSTLIDMAKVFVIKPLGVYLIDIFDNLNTPMYGLPNMVLFYEKAKRLGTSDFVIYREIVLHAFIVFSALIIGALLLTTTNWRLFFSLAAVGALMAYAIDFDKN
ncbi:hypothetical protein JXA34_01675 [Patescibacteria group bacterium]|nr:hypothetical protein [Patescibacteria group bacterium]